MRQRLGQHFLRDRGVLQAIVQAAELSGTETVLEIGPGRGFLTDALLPRAGRLVAVELDDRLAAALASRPGLTVVHQDFLETDLDALFPPAERPVKVLGNLPYAITAPIFEKLLAWPGWQSGVFLVQQEVAERMGSAPGSRAFGILSLAVQVFATVERIARVKPGAFAPPPRVHSAVIRLRRRPAPEVREELLPAFFDVAHGAFAHRRKTLANSLAMFSGQPRPVVERWLREQGVDPGRRAESLSLPDYVRMAGPWAIFRR